MLTTYFSRQTTQTTYYEGPAGPYLDLFTHWLAQRGYRHESIRRRLAGAAQFVTWAQRTGCPLQAISPTTLGRFRSHLAQQNQLGIGVPHRFRQRSVDAVPIPWRVFPYHDCAGAHRGFPSSVDAVVVDHQNPPHQGMRPEVRHRLANAGFVVVCGQDYGEVGIEYRIDRHAPMGSFLGQLKQQLGGHEDHSQ